MKLFKKYKAVVYLPNVYSLLQYYLLAPYPLEDTLFFFHFRYPKSIVQRILGAEILEETSLRRIFSLLKVYWLALYNHNISVFLCGEICYTNLFLRLFKHISYFEDGTASYEKIIFEERQVKQKAKGILRRLFIGDCYPWYGLADNVERNYLTGILPIPDIIVNKTVIINLQELWQNKSHQQQKEILDIFLPNDLDLNSMKGCETILLTQPFDKPNGFTESDKIEVYRRLLSGYDESKVLIKTHPTEKTDYSTFFPLAKIINTSCPMEILTLLGITFKRAITVNSTAIFSMNDTVEKIIAGYNVTPELMKEAKRWGDDKGISVRMNNKQPQ